MYQALYRKYRPAVFDDVCGQEHITSILKYEAAHNRVSHAYLFCGSRGTGKTTCAKILAKAVNCTDLQNGNPCGRCPSCTAIDQGSVTDVLEMDAASNNGVDYIRDIRDAVAYTPAMLKKRVYIIDEVHMLSGSAFNALLKTLEEPPEHVVFILATTELHKLPATIISRCQRFDFRRISLPILAQRLHYIADAEGITLQADAALRIARQAQGGMRDAISLMELCSGGGAAVTVERAEELLGLSSYDQISAAAAALAQADIPHILEILAEAASSSRDISVFWQELIAFYRDMMIEKYSGDTTGYLDLTEQEMRILHETSEMFSVRKIAYHCTVLDEALSAMQRMPQMKRTTAEFACLRMCEPQLDTTPEALSARIGQLEDRLALLESGVAPITAPVKQPMPTKTAESLAVPASSVRVEAEKAPSAVSSEEAWTLLPDMSEFSEKLASADKQTHSFMANASLALSHDGTRARVLCSNAFAARMLSSETAKAAILRTLAICRITSGQVELSIETVRETAAGNPAADELYQTINQ